MTALPTLAGLVRKLERECFINVVFSFEELQIREQQKYYDTVIYMSCFLLTLEPWSPLSGNGFH